MESELRDSNTVDGEVTQLTFSFNKSACIHS